MIDARCKSWAAGRTIMLRRISKRVKEAVDKMRLPAGVRLSRSFWGDARVTSISAGIRSDEPGQRGLLEWLQECCRSVQRWRTSISAGIRSEQAGQGGLQECLRSAQRWITWISAPIRSALSGKGGCELCGVVKPLALFCRHLELLALCNLFSRQAIRMSDIVYTNSVVAFGLALSL
jgi:hypothetical protein